MNRTHTYTFLIILGIFMTAGMAAHSSTDLIGKTKNPSFSTVTNETVLRGETPLYFIPNKGQVGSEALFYTKTQKYNLWLTQDGLLFDSLWNKNTNTPESIQKMQKNIRPCELIRQVSAIKFLGVDQDAEVVPLDKSDYFVNYFIGCDPTGWKSDIPTSKAVLYKDLYSHIDLKLYGIESQIEYDWIVKPGGDPVQIQLAYDGVKNLKINKDGDLVVESTFSKLVHKKPFAYQWINGQKKEVKVSFQKIEETTFGFTVGEYKPEYELIIDPILAVDPLLVFVYSSYLGGSEIDEAWDITVDGTGQSYITGHTFSDDFPTTAGAYNVTPKGGGDVFVTKFTSTGTDLIYSTFIGGTSTDWSYGIKVDEDEYVYLAGATASPNFPIAGGAFDNSYNGEIDAFVAKLNKNGSALMFSTFIGGIGEDTGYDIALGSDGSLFITGSTNSNDFPTTKGADDRTFGGIFDGFVSKLDSEASKLIYSTYVGDLELEELFGIALDHTDAAYVTGYIDYDGTQESGDSEVLAVKLNSKGSLQEYSFIFGGGDDESGRAVVVDEFKKAYIVGWTVSSNFPTTDEAFDPTYNGHSDAFVCKLLRDGSDFVYCSYLGGSCFDWGEDIDLYDDLSAVVTGYTTTGDFPVTEDAYDRTHNGYADAFVSYVSPDGRDLPYSTFLGGEQTDYGTGIAVDVNLYTHTTGYTRSTDFPVTPNAYSLELNNPEEISDAYFVKFVREWPISIVITKPENGAGVAGVVPIEATVEADGEVAWVTFEINGELLFTDYEAPYRYDWDSRDYQSFLGEEFKIRVTASDTAAEPHMVQAQISVYALNGTLELQAERGVFQSWLVQMEYAVLDLTVLSSDTLEKAEKYEFLRKKEGDVDWYIMKTIDSSQLEGTDYTFVNQPLEPDTTYRYVVVAKIVDDETGEEEVVGISEVKTI